MTCSAIKRLPKPGERLLWKGDVVVVLEIIGHGNFASTVAVRDNRKRVWEVRKEELYKPNKLNKLNKENPNG